MSGDRKAWWLSLAYIVITVAFWASLSLVAVLFVRNNPDRHALPERYCSHGTLYVFNPDKGVYRYEATLNAPECQPAPVAAASTGGDRDGR